MKKKYLILGASGFIGQNLVRELLKKDVELTLFDIKMLDEFKNNSKIKYIEDRFDVDTDFNRLTENQNIVIHLISTTSPNSKKSIEEEIDENVKPTIRLLDSCVKNNIEKFVFISSGGTVYGKSNNKPFKESDTTTPICNYGVHKITIEKYIQLYESKFGLNYSIIRLSNPYGPGQNPKGQVGAITVFGYQILHDEPITIYGDGLAVRDYIFIEDVVRDILELTSTNLKGVYNLGSSEGTSLLDIINVIETSLDKKANVTFLPSRINDLKYSVLDTDKIKNLGITKEHLSLNEGIEKTLDYLKRNYGD